MIRVRVKRVSGHVAGLTVSGHAGSGPKGEDLVCAAVSALVQTYFFSLQRLLGMNIDADVRDGYFSFQIPAETKAETRERATFLAESLLVGLDEINNSYSGYLQVSEE
ncbi:MAG: ribosomal-processing cysteine protease Prp [Bacillota bacterium]|nr:ribosomal-processing cysteine protease Prp [Bacillota bacterium]MDW7683304.1 ribosomal-processing cysteine protease Prp [Bacillota bacterium]